MTAFLFASFISVVGSISVAVLVRSGKRAFAAFRELRHALASCPDIVIAEINIVQPVLRPQLRLVSQAARPLQTTSGLRAAA